MSHRAIDRQAPSVLVIMPHDGLDTGHGWILVRLFGLLIIWFRRTYMHALRAFGRLQGEGKEKNGEKDGTWARWVSGGGLSFKNYLHCIIGSTLYIYGMLSARMIILN